VIGLVFMRVTAKVKPGASFNKIIQIDNNQFEIFTTASAVNGKANKAVIEILAEFFDVAPSRISLVKGARSKQKTFEIN